MSSKWVPSWLARALGRARDWVVQLEGLELHLRQGAVTTRFSVGEVTEVSIARGFIWSSVVLDRGTDPVVLTGMNRQDASRLQDALAAAQDELRRLNDLVARFKRAAEQAEVWWSGVRKGLDQHTFRWIPLEVAGQWAKARPKIQLQDFNARREPALASFCASQPPGILEAIEAWETIDVASMVRNVNTKFLAEERVRLRDFFETVESSPLTDEQVEAVVSFDNRVRVIAAAGSGKTSTMVARAGYAILREIAEPDEILLLAFNKKAADELGQRAGDRLGPGGSRIAAKTFHSFGLEVIGTALNRRPTVASDLTSDSGLARVRRVVDEIRDVDAAFRRDWDLFRLVYAGCQETGEDETPSADEMVTLAGEKVKSQEELMIANWLFYHGVDYEYERPYEYDTSDEQHRQYTPDFYYPAIAAYHEHWAINSQGQPPPQFQGYREAMAWKHAVHARLGTTLIETTSASIRNGSGFEHLAAELTSRGIELDENLDREPEGPEPLKDKDMLSLVRTFLVHAKNNRIDVELLQARFGAGFIRTRLFLHIAAKAHHGWELSLRRDGVIDFEDMLNQAADLIEAGKWHNPYKVVMVDELQDTSVARARLIRELTKEPVVFLYGVGDDWQSINRFAGADLSVMSNFETWFGPGPTIRLQRTFRSCQAICDVAGPFVMENPGQLPKTVFSTERGDTPAVRALMLKSWTDYSDGIESCLTELDAQAARRGTGKVSVFVLGRYRRDKDLLKAISHREFTNLDIEFSTVHGAKGREAEYVILPGMTVGGFPSSVTDDPLLDLVTPQVDDFPAAEERRLFYVALTRARRAIIMLADRRKISPFLRELIREKKVTVTSPDADIVARPCPKCASPMMVKRESQYGRFLGCIHYGDNQCTGTVPLPPL